VKENEKRNGHERTLCEQLDKFYLHLNPYPFPQYTLKDKTKIRTSERRMGIFSLWVPAPLLDEIKRVASSQCFKFDDFMVKILAERIGRELYEDPTLLLRISQVTSQSRLIEKWKYRRYRTRDYFDIKPSQ